MYKKLAIVIMLWTLVLFSPGFSDAASPNNQITGAVMKVEIFPRSSALSGNPNMTMITFADRRVVIFQGIIMGYVFKLNETYTITYDSNWAFIDVKMLK